MSDGERTIFLDTSAAIAALRNIPGTLERLSEVRTVVSPIVLAELYQGAYKATATDREMNKITLLLQTSVIVNCDQATSRIFAHIRHELGSIGKSIPLHDIWIAASALQYGIPLATRDAHFERVSGLSVEYWL